MNYGDKVPHEVRAPWLRKARIQLACHQRESGNMQKMIAFLLSSSGKGLRVASGSRVFNLTVLLTALLVSTGCATTSTLSQPVHERKPLVMSGTRLDLASLRNEPAVKEKFGVSAPRYPLLDLPFSLVLDFFALGFTVPVALFY